MSPAERARQIDREEFEAECLAARQRAYATFGHAPARPVDVERWVKRKEPKGSFAPQRIRIAESKPKRIVGRAKLYTAHGQTFSIDQWAAQTGMSRHTIRNRLDIGWTVEDAVTRPVVSRDRPGVSPDFALFEGTGAGSTAQETPNITFFEKAENA